MAGSSKQVAPPSVAPSSAGAEVAGGGDSAAVTGYHGDMQAMGDLFDQLMSGDPDRTTVLKLWGRVGPEGQRMIMVDRRLAQAMMGVLVVAPGDKAAEPAEVPVAPADPQVAMALAMAHRARAIAFGRAMAAKAGAPGKSDAAALSQEPVYLSQRDNVTDDTEKNVHGDNMCNVTTLAMQIASIAGSVDRAREAVVAAIEMRGGVVSAADREAGQVEDLLYQRFQMWGVADWKAAAIAKEPPFDTKALKGWESWGTGNTKFHQQAACHMYVTHEIEKKIPEIGEILHDEESVKVPGESQTHAGMKLVSQEYFEDVLKPECQAGGNVMLSTKLTDGHIVMLVDVIADGVVINDPYGAKTIGPKAYMKNGSTPASVEESAASQSALKERFKLRSDLQAWMSDGADARADLGEHVFFSWADITTWQIGRWNTVMRRSDSGDSA